MSVASLSSRRIGGRPALWVVLGLVVVGTLLFGQIIGRQTSSASERIITLEKEVKCLSCIDLSVYNSQGASSFTIRTYIRNEVRLGRTNNEILDGLVSAYGTGVLMSPPGGGIDSLLWLAPLGLLLLGGGELARRRWISGTALEPSLAGGGEESSRSDIPLMLITDRVEPIPSMSWSKGDGQGPESFETLISQSSTDELPAAEHPPIAPPERSWVKFFGRRQNWFLVAAIAFLLLGGGVGTYAIVGGSGGASTTSLTASQRTTVEEEVVQGELLASEGSDVAALKLLASALKLDPEQPQALTYDGWLLFQAGQKDHSTALDNQGRLLLQEAATVDPGYPTVHLFLGLVDVALHRAPTSAVVEFNTMLKDGINPTLLRSAKSTIADAYRAAGRPVPKSL